MVDFNHFLIKQVTVGFCPQGYGGKNHFILVTNIAPCSGVRLHLWPGKGKSASKPVDRRVLEVTTKMVHIPSGPTPTQVLKYYLVLFSLLSLKRNWNNACSFLSFFHLVTLFQTNFFE